jgi:Fe-S-cluster containining protein
MIEVNMSNVCKRCGNCCKCLVLPVKKPLNKSIMNNWLSVRDCEIVKEDYDSTYVKINYKCPHLVKSVNEYLCDIYEDRPNGCREFDGRNYDFLDCALKKLPKLVILEKSRRR